MVLGLSVALCYAQVSSHQFVWDTEHIFKNEQLRTFSVENTLWIFTHAVISNWHPVSWISHTVDFTVFGWSPGGHHLVNVFIHFMNGVLVFMLVKMLFLQSISIDRPRDETRVILISALSALIFVLHPLRVESVAWVAARKDLLYSFFTLLALVAYILYRDIEMANKRRRYYFISLSMFFLALLSKSMAVTLPAVLIILDCFAMNRVKLKHSLKKPQEWLWVARQLLPDKVPFIGLSIIVIIITVITQADALPTATLTVGNQILNTLHNIGSYLVLLFLPVNLSPFYPFPPLQELSAISYWLPSLMAIAILSGLGIWAAIRGETLPLCCWLLYLVTLLPASGIIHVGSATSADRYTYLTLLPIIVLLSVGLVDLYQKFTRIRSITISFILFGLLTLGMLTHAQVSHWKTPITLWSRVLQLYPDAALAHRNISSSLRLMGDYEQALFHLEYISDRGWNVDKELAGTLAQLGQNSRALVLLQKMILSGSYSEEESQLLRIEMEGLTQSSESSAVDTQSVNL